MLASFLFVRVHLYEYEKYQFLAFAYGNSGRENSLVIFRLKTAQIFSFAQFMNEGSCVGREEGVGVGGKKEPVPGWDRLFECKMGYFFAFLTRDKGFAFAAIRRDSLSTWV